MTCFMLSDTKYHLPRIDESRPNQVDQSRSLITTALEPSSGRGSRPRIGFAPSVGYMSFEGHAMEIRSTRSPARNVELPPPKKKIPSSSFDLSL